MKTTDFQQTVGKIYGAGAALYVDTLGKLAVDGKLPPDTKKYIRDHKDQFRQMLTGDPLQGPGWEGRTALYRQALKYLDDLVERKGLDNDAAVKALCRVDVNDRLSTAWSDGSFEDFRRALKEYIQTGLDAARGKKPKMKLTA